MSQRQDIALAIQTLEMQGIIKHSDIYDKLQEKFPNIKRHVFRGAMSDIKSGKVTI